MLTSELRAWSAMCGNRTGTFWIELARDVQKRETLDSRLRLMLLLAMHNGKWAIAFVNCNGESFDAEARFVEFLPSPKSLKILSWVNAECQRQQRQQGCS